MKTSLFRFCGVLLLAAMLAPVCVHARKNPKNPKNNMRLLYWNIQNGMWSGQGDNYDKFVEWVRAYDPDVCVWCEAQSIYKTGTADKIAAAQQAANDASNAINDASKAMRQASDDQPKAAAE